MKDKSIEFVFHTIQQLHDLNCSPIPANHGIYVIDVPKGFQVSFVNATTVIETFKGRSMLYPANEL